VLNAPPETVLSERLYLLVHCGTGTYGTASPSQGSEGGPLDAEMQATDAAIAGAGDRLEALVLL